MQKSFSSNFRAGETHPHKKKYFLWDGLPRQSSLELARGLPKGETSKLSTLKIARLREVLTIVERPKIGEHPDFVKSVFW